jgi:nucleoside permease NupC
MKAQGKPSAATRARAPLGFDATKTKSKEMENMLHRVHTDMKVEVRAAIVALIVGIVILEITLITVLNNLTGWTLLWVGFPGLIVSVLLLYVVYLLFRHRSDLKKLADLMRDRDQDDNERFGRGR